MAPPPRGWRVGAARARRPAARGWRLLSGCCCLEPVGQLLRVAEGAEVAARHLLGGDAEALLRDALLEVDREEAVVAAREQPGRYVGPCLKWPRLAERGV